MKAKKGLILVKERGILIVYCYIVYKPTNNKEP